MTIQPKKKVASLLAQVRVDNSLSSLDLEGETDNLAHHDCDHQKHVFTECSDNCLRTETLLQLRVSLVSFFPDGSLFKSGPKPRRFAKMLLESWKQHFPDSQESTRSLSIKLGNYDKCHVQNKPVSKSGRIQWSQKMIKDVKISRDAALSRLGKEAEDKMMKPRSLTSYWREEWEKMYPHLSIDFKRVVTRYIGLQTPPKWTI